MDSITHIALGACIGELYAGKSLGKKALIIGAVAQSIPDIDFIASFWLSPANDLMAHRRFTHSFLFVLLTAYPLALIVSRWKWLAASSIRQLTIFISLEMLVHLFLDAFNAYGTAWFEPFSHYRVAFHTLFVADPIFSLGLGIAAIVLTIKSKVSKRRIQWASLAIAISIGYLIFGLITKASIQKTVKVSLAEQHIECKRYFTTPTPGNVLLWYIVVESKDGFYIGHRSVFDSEKNILFYFFEQNSKLLDTLSDKESLQLLIRFSEGYYIVKYYDDRLVFNDLRFGQMLGWNNPKAPFVFYYFLEHPNDNELLIQRGRFAKWTKESVFEFIDKILGK